MKRFVLIVALFVSLSVFGEDLYKIGQTAYSKKDYVTALKYLFAYKTLNENALLQNPSFLSDLNKSIEISEANIRGQFVDRSIFSGTTNPRMKITGSTFGAQGYEIPDIIKELNAKGLKVSADRAEGIKLLDEAIKTQERQLQILKEVRQPSGAAGTQ